MQRRRTLAWLGTAAVLATAVVALRHTQTPADAERDAPRPLPARPVQLPRYVADGVVPPEPSGPPSSVPGVLASRTGQHRVRVAWADGLPGGSAPDNTVGYDVRWRATRGGGVSGVAEENQRLVVAPEIELDGLREDSGYAIEVRSVNPYGRRSSPAVATLPTLRSLPVAAPDLRQYTGLAEPFDGPFSVDSSVLAARWHLSGYPGCTRAATDGGTLAVDLACGADLAVLRARAPLRLSPGGERGRVVLVTDGAGPRSSLTIDLAPGPVDRVGIERGPPGAWAAGTPEDPALPAGAIRVVIDDDGVRVFAGPGVPRFIVVPDRLPTPVATRGVGVLHVFELVLDARGLRVLQDGDLAAVAGVTPPGDETYLLIGLGGPSGQQARVRVDSVGFSGDAAMGPLTYTHPVVLATQRVLGTGELAPGIGISRDRLTGARSARLFATVRTAPGVDLGGLLLQQGDTLVPARPVSAVPTAAGADVTVVSDLLPQLLGPDGPPAISPLVLRAPGAENTVVSITDSYLDIVPLSGMPSTTPGSPGPSGPSRPDASLPRPALTVLDTNSREVDTVPAGARVVVQVDLDGLAGQLGAARLAGIAGFQLWLSGRLVASVPTAVDGAGVGGSYRVALSTETLQPGRQSIELRVIASDAAVSPASVLSSWHQL